MDKNKQYLPCIIYQVDITTFNINIDTENKTIYQTLFKKYGYSGNGYSWSGHIIQILEKEQPNLLPKISFDPEAGAFYAFAKDYKSQIEFAYIISKVFNNIEQLESYIKNADRSRIDD